MATAVRAGAWRELLDTGLFGWFVLLCVGVWLHSADSLVMATIVPAVVDDIGGVTYVGWTISLYQIGAVISGATTALICRSAGVRRVLAAAALIYAVGCVIAAASPNMASLLGGRLVQGVGGGMRISLSYVAIQQSFAEHLWSRLFGIVAVIWGVGSLLGPLIGGVFASLGAWRGAFWCFTLQAGALWALAMILLPIQPPEQPSEHRVGGSFHVLPLLALSVAILMVAQAGAIGRVAVSVPLSLAGIGLLYMAARLDQRSAQKLLPAHVLDVCHPMGAGLLMVLALSAATTGFWTYGPLLLKIMFGTPPLVSGYILAGEALAWSAATMAVSAASSSAEPALIRLGVVLVAAGAASFAVVVPAGSLTGMIACALLQGLGFGLCWPSIVRRTVRFADDRDRILAAAAPGTVQRIGYAVGAAATGIAGNASGLADGVSLTTARTAGFWVFASFIPVLLVGVFGAWRFTGGATRPDLE
jgi:MFS family permease